MKENPKTITLYGRGQRRFQVFAGVWADCLEHARQNKSWAEKTNRSRNWKANASIMSLELLQKCLTKTVAELAADDYRYLELRAHLRSAYYGPGYPLDKPAYERWTKLGGKIIRQRRKAKAT